jgi:hypothetical protein
MEHILDHLPRMCTLNRGFPSQSRDNYLTYAATVPTAFPPLTPRRLVSGLFSVYLLEPSQLWITNEEDK